MTRFRVIVAAAFLAGILAASFNDVAYARSPEIYTGILSSTAAGGYDAVAYFEEGRAVEGKREFTHAWKGATWRFANEKHRDAFKANPEAYAPQYGGHCAWAVSQGYTAKGDPKYWKVVGGKLYLNYNAKVQQDWAKDIAGNVSKADRNWPKVLDK